MTIALSRRELLGARTGRSRVAAGVSVRARQATGRRDLPRVLERGAPAISRAGFTNARRIR